MIESADKHIKIGIMTVFHKFNKLNMLSGDIKIQRPRIPWWSSGYNSTLQC